MLAAYVVGGNFLLPTASCRVSHVAEVVFVTREHARASFSAAVLAVPKAHYTLDGKEALWRRRSELSCNRRCALVRCGRGEGK